MALKVTLMDDLFFKSLFKGNEQVLQTVALLTQHGVKFQVALYSVTATSPNGGLWAVNTTIGTTTLLKGLGGDLQKPNMLAVHDMLGNICAELAIAGPSADSMTLPAEQGSVQGSLQLGPLVPTATPAKPLKKSPIPPKFVKAEPTVTTAVGGPTSPSDAPVKLREASVLGQKVLGTSAGSVYFLVAGNPRVKVAARIRPDTLSLRVEVNDATAEEMAAIKSVVSWHGDYGSIHMGLLGIPCARVLGALLMDLAVDFDAKVANPKELHYEN